MLRAAVDQASDEHLAGVMAAVVSGEMWVEFDHLVEGLDDHGRGRLRAVVGAAPPDAFARLRAAGRLGAEATELVSAAAALR
jgi:methylmalonyl-CoA mutase cobalamin-binding subunit